MADFSCYVEIINNTSVTMTLIGMPVNTHGEYVVYPSTSLNANGGSTSFQIQQDNALSPGPVGSCVFSVQDAGGNSANITFSYACPVTGTNAADAVLDSNVAVNIQMIPNPLPQYGHPVNVQYTISDN